MKDDTVISKLAKRWLAIQLTKLDRPEEKVG